MVFGDSGVVRSIGTKPWPGIDLGSHHPSVTRAMLSWLAKLSPFILPR